MRQLIRSLIWIETQRVGGIRFLRIGRLQFIFCVTRANPWLA
jgi:hypothetical protein